MTVTCISTVFGVEIDEYELAMKLVSYQPLITKIMSNESENLQIPTPEQVQLVIDSNMNQTINKDIINGINDTIFQFLCHVKDMVCVDEFSIHLCQGMRHKHNSSEYVIGVHLFNADCEGPGSTSSFSVSLENFKTYRKKIKEYETQMKVMGIDTSSAEMHAIANDCQCCS
jgi:hypothetical protein